MGINSIQSTIKLIALGLLLITPFTHVKADWSNTFIEGVNNINDQGSINLNTSFIYNAPTNGQLPTFNYVQGGNASAKLCVPSNNNAKDCKPGDFNASLPVDRLDFSQCESDSTDDFGPPSWEEKTIEIPEGEYQNIIVDGGSDRTVQFTSNNAEGIYKIKDLSANSGNIIFAPGQYWIESLFINNGVNVTFPTDGTVTLFIKSDYTHSNKSFTADPERLLIYTYGDFTLNGGTSLGAYVVAEGNATLDGSSELVGAVTANNIYLEGSSSLTFDGQSDQISVTPNCDIATPPDTFHIQYGKATSGSVVFDTAFPDGVTPLVFLMPTIEQTNTNNDGPASVFLTGTPTTNGFNWTQQEPESQGNRYVQSEDMTEVHWIAVTEGTHELPNGTELIAGTVELDNALIGSNSQYVNVALPSTQNVVLNQLQTQVNDCWFTSLSQFNNAGIGLAMDTSEVRSNNTRCQPGNLNNNEIQSETVAYLSVESGSGSMVLNSENLNFHFGEAQTFTNGNIQNLAYQCNYTSDLEGFTNPPIFVAGKNSRRGGDGGWLRRCQLTNSIVSIAVDEDTYRDNDRSHIWENYSFIALEKTEPVLECFNDDFQRSDVGDDWVVSESRGGFIPAIVNNRLRITQAAGNQATSSTYQRLFPAADNLVVIEFDHYAYGGSGADGIAFVLSDASITPQPGSYGGPLGYGARSNDDGFAGGWLGFGIDEYGNFSTEGGPGGPGRRQQSVAVRGSGSGTSGYDYLRGTCNNGQDNPNGDCLTPTVDNNENANHRYRITVDSQVAGQSMVSVERDTGSGFVTLIAPFDAAAEANQSNVPTDFLLSLTGSTGGATNNHEIDNVEICALDSNPIGVVIDHFEFTHTGAALTCNAEPMTLKACANADCSQTVPDFVTATLSPATIAAGGGWVGGNVVSFSGGSTNLELRNNTAGSVTVDVTGSTPGAKPFSTTLCSVAGNTPTAAQCTFNFADSGFIFDVPDKLANKPSGVISISAVEKDSETLECVPQFADVTKSVGFWSDYVSPDESAVISGQNVSVTGAGAATNIGTTQTARTPINLDFNSNGIAEIEVNYPDAGEVQLNAQYDGTGDEAGLVMVGADPFVSFPVGLCVEPIDANASCSAGNSTCPVYKKAGEEFELIVKGMAWESDTDTDYCDNPSTPNYAHAGITLGSNLVAPSGGVEGMLGLSAYDHVAASDNVNNLTQTISEVGVFEFTAKAPSSYLGSSFYDIPLASSGNIGRFIPDRFVISGVSVLPACGIFNYMDQPFSMAMNISAFNIGSEITKNYQDSFAYATALLVGENADDGDDKRNRMSALPVSASSWSAGVATIDSSYMARLSRAVAPSQDGPFEDFDIGVIVVDNDGDALNPLGYSFVADPDMNAATAGSCGSNCDAKQISTQRFRHGRVVMDNTYGAENDTLQMPTRSEYWNGSAWVLNIDDSCSVVTPALVSQVDDVVLGYQFEPALTNGQVIERTGQTASFTNGEFTLLWNAIITGSAEDYRGQVTAPLIVPDWLQWYWNWDNISSTTLYDPRASAYFGRYRGHDRVIYWREKR
ncbi:DUF6701 domain-containing protein [Shewanella goraebulensis]|uniref:DUF6701 domain-containing protein n=1 Tax=Shewanella goraebulensis TaxID=3050637 RepID=UPI002550C998|nr:DUF6701 domain-containing protein [Shewanella goraebulensis]